MLTKHLVYQLAIKHHFSMSNYRDTLWIDGPEGIGDLIITIREDDLGYVLAVTLPSSIKSRTIVTGFRVYYDIDWKPVIAVNERGALYRDAIEADKRMCKIIEKYYMDREKSWVRNQGYMDEQKYHG